MRRKRNTLKLNEVWLTGEDAAGNLWSVQADHCAVRLRRDGKFAALFSLSKPWGKCHAQMLLQRDGQPDAAD